MTIRAGFRDIRVKDCHLSNAQIRSLNASPVTLIPAPGSGYGVLVLWTYWYLKFVSSYDLTDTPNAYIHISNPAFRAASSFNGWWESPLAGIFDTTQDGPHTPGFDGFAFVGSGPGSPNAPWYAWAGGSDPLPFDKALIDDQPTVMGFDRTTAGEMGGGDAANSLSLRVWYVIVPTAPFA